MSEVGTQVGGSLLREDVDRAGAVVETGDAAAGGVGEADFRTFDLMLAGAAFELADDLDGLRCTGCADGVAA